jgi:glyoxylase-like metal-dependent hydrolase (beta-lactamase superfamily II)
LRENGRGAVPARRERRALAEPVYEVYALRYGARSDWTRAKSYMNDADPNAPDEIEYFLWIVRNENRTFVVDTGFDQATALRYKRTPFVDPSAQLRAFGIDPATVDDLIVTHMHFDHVGALPAYMRARFHLQQADLAYATSSSMKYDFLRFAYDVVHVSQMLERVYSGRGEFHDGDEEVAPGLSLHRIDGHAIGLQVIRVNTARGPIVLASDAAAYIEQFADYRVSPAVVNAEAMLHGYDRLRELAASEDHIITGHDPITSRIYPKVPGVDANVYRLDVPPTQSIREAMAAWKSRKI